MSANANANPKERTALCSHDGNILTRPWSDRTNRHIAAQQPHHGNFKRWQESAPITSIWTSTAVVNRSWRNKRNRLQVIISFDWCSCRKQRTEGTFCPAHFCSPHLLKVEFRVLTFILHTPSLYSIGFKAWVYEQLPRLLPPLQVWIKFAAKETFALNILPKKTFLL